jgi:ankyrin repeat domain-containing protein 50
MDPLSATASAIAIIQITEQVWILLQQYILAVKDAKRDIERLGAEVLALHDVLEKVADLKNDSGFAELKTLDLLSKPGGLFHQCLDDLKELSAKLDRGHGPNAMKRVGWRALKWPFTNKEVDKRIVVLERYKTTFNLALSTDNT